jgi:sugar fermentation stimulation protein A
VGKCIKPPKDQQTAQSIKDGGMSMTYQTVIEGLFIERPNRFIAKILIEGKEEICHVKNTGRCKELLVPGAVVFLEDHRQNIKTRKTKFSLIGVQKGDKLINIDSQAPNKVVGEWLRTEALFSHIQTIKPEYSYKASRFDFFVQTEDKKYLIEVKGVTLEDEGTALFPDAPTMRGLKHIEELCNAQREGYETYLIFVIQMKGVQYFTPNAQMQQAFFDALKEAQKQGVLLLAYDCYIEKDSMVLADPVKIRL